MCLSLKTKISAILKVFAAVILLHDTKGIFISFKKVQPYAHCD